MLQTSHVRKYFRWMTIAGAFGKRKAGATTHPGLAAQAEAARGRAGFDPSGLAAVRSIHSHQRVTQRSLNLWYTWLAIPHRYR